MQIGGGRSIIGCEHQARPQPNTNTHRTRPASRQIQIHIALGPPSTIYKDHIIIMAPLMELHIDFAIVVEFVDALGLC